MLAWLLAEQGHEAGQALEHAGEAAHAAGEAAHGAAHHGPLVPELPNLLGVIHGALSKLAPGFTKTLDGTVAGWGFNDPLGTPFTAFEGILYALLAILGLSIFFISGYRRLKRSPKEGRLSRRALFIEIIVLFFDDFFGQVLGKKEGRKHLAFIGTLFIYIFVLNTFGLIWLGKAPTANLSFNMGLALLVFLYVHFTGISRGAVGYLKHYPGDLPSIKELGMGPIGGGLIIGFMAILFTVIHILEAVIQPVSLALRLFGNVLGKDVLLGVFGGLMPLLMLNGVIYVYFPWHTPFLFLGLLLGAIQALIFSLLSAIYITLWLPHEHDHGHGHEHAEEHA
jgi:F-type H+-transporting ATPase subunit a